MSEIYLIRHGSTEANERHLYCGASDLPLSERGRRELEALKPHYPAVTGCRFITSGMRRTDETLQILFGKVSFAVEPRLREIDFGAFELRSYEELKDDPDYQAWLSGDNEKNIPPGGESGEQMCRRVLTAFRELRDTDLDTVIVTHGGVIAAIMEELFPEESRNRYEWQPGPGQGYVLNGERFSPVPSGWSKL